MGRLLRVLGVAALTLATAACWPVPGQNADQTGYNEFENGLSLSGLHQLWNWSGDTVGPGTVSAPVLSTSGVHVTQGCSVFTLNPATGAERWSAMVASDPASCEAPMGGVLSSPFVVDPGDGPRVVASFGVLTAEGLARPWVYNTEVLEAATGFEQGTASVGFLNSLRGRELVGVTRHEEVLLPYNELELGGFFGPGRSFKTGVASLGGPTLAGPGFTTAGTDKVFHSGFGLLATTPGDATQGNGIRAFSKTEARPGCGPIITGHPTLPAVEVECPLWVNPLDGSLATNAVIYPGGTTLYVSTAAGNLYVINALNGETQWTASGARGRPALAGYLLYVPTADGRVLGFFASGCGQATCAPDFVLRTPTAGVVSTPAVAGGYVWVTQGGDIYAWTAGSGCSAGLCLPQWDTPTGATSLSSPVVSNGQLYVSTGTELLAYGN